MDHLNFEHCNHQTKMKNKEQIRSEINESMISGITTEDGPYRRQAPARKRRR